jgi:hypothetical protein
MAMVGDWLGDMEPERKRRLSLAVIVSAGLMLVGGGVLLMPVQEASPDAVTMPMTGHVKVDGFRSALFGMKEGAVRAAIATDFGGRIGDMAQAVRVVENKVERTRVLVVRVPDLYPGAGLTEIGYVLGYKSQALMQVNLLWGTPLTPRMTSADIGMVTATLLRYFADEGFSRDQVKANVRLGKGATMVFQGSDAKGRMVQLVRRAELPPASATGDKAADAKPSDDRRRLTLRLSYIADPKAPDIFKIEKGQF